MSYQVQVLTYSCHQLIIIFIKRWEAGKGLGLQQLEALVKMVPTKEEEAKLCSYEGDINELESVEKFFKEILEIPFAFRRVEAMLYRENFEDEVVQFRKSFSMLEVTINHKHISFDQTNISNSMITLTLIYVVTRRPARNSDQAGFS